ncbi:hypothetical protein HYU22_00515 [Candidatus Woesearchaeota archaeon]|nr:hypothetical protein [Candidatus Woesearchaeota archaeon]
MAININDSMNGDGAVNKENIMKIMPYHEKFLMLDHVEFLDHKKIIAIKDVPLDDFWVGYHFVNFPIMPGVLIIEFLAQAGSLLARYNIPHHEGKDILAHTISNSRFIHPVFPGDRLKCEVLMSEFNGNKALFHGKAWANNQLCSEAEFTLAAVDKERFRNKFMNVNKR